VSTDSAHSPAVFLPDLRRRLTEFAFGSANFSTLSREAEAGPGEHLQFYRKLLPVSAEIVPDVESALGHACRRLALPRLAVHAFIQPSAEPNAACFIGIRGSAVIILNAGMVECLVPEELAYVIGHELGHYIMPLVCRDDSIEDAMAAREVELVMDRFGLLACGDLKHAGSAILKIQSGLSSRHIRSDLSAFMQSGRTAIDAEVQERETRLAHPPEFVRLRALRDFAMSDVFRRALGQEGGHPISEINETIRRDLDRAVDGHARLLIDQSLGRLAQTLVSYLVANKIKVEVAKFSHEGVVIDLERVRAMASNWAALSDDKRAEAFSKRLADQFPACAGACPRRAHVYLDTLIANHLGSPIVEVCRGVQHALNEVRGRRRS